MAAEGGALGGMAAEGGAIMGVAMAGQQSSKPVLTLGAQSGRRARTGSGASIKAGSNTWKQVITSV